MISANNYLPFHDSHFNFSFFAVSTKVNKYVILHACSGFGFSNLNTASKEETREPTSADRRSLLYTKSANPGFASVETLRLF